MLILVDDHIVTFALRDAHRNDLAFEPALILCGDGPLVRPERKLVLLGSRDVVDLAHVLGSFQHSTRHRVAAAAGGDPRPDETILQLDVPTPLAPPDVVRIELGAAHALGATRDDYVGHSGLDLHSRDTNGQKAGPAAAVELKSRRLDRQSGVECCNSSDRRCLAIRVALAEDGIVDALRIQFCLLEQSPDDRSGEDVGFEVAERSPEPTDRGPEWATDDGFLHD